MEAPTQNGLRCCDGMTFVERGDGLEDCLEWVALVLTCVSKRKPVQTFAALVHLERAHAVASLSFADRICTLALWTWRALFGVPEATPIGRGRALNCCDGCG